MPESRILVRKAAILGAGVMGAQIAAHLANAGVPTLLFDLAAKERDPNDIAQRAIENLKKLEPSRQRTAQPGSRRQITISISRCFPAATS